MINFFRKLRQKNIKNNKFSRYLLYAIGEIILVVIGIVIALQINNWNENKRSFEKTELLLKQVHKELATNIKNANTVIDFYRSINTNFYKVINKKVTEDDYRPNVGLPFLLLRVETVDPTSDAFANLLNSKGELSKEQEIIVFKLNELYKKDKKEVDILDQKVIKDLFKFIDELSETKAWYGAYSRNGKITDELIQYFLENPFYYNKIINFELINLKNHLLTIINFRNKSLESYGELTNYLQISKNTKILKNIADFEHYIGSYSLEGKSNIIIKITKQEGLIHFILEVKNTNNPNYLETLKIYPETKSTFMTASNFGTIVFDAEHKVSELILELGAAKQKFIKIDK